MSLRLWEAIQDASVRSDPIFTIRSDWLDSQPPSLQRVLLAAAALWCRKLVWPTLREIGLLAAVAPSTSIRAVGSSDGLRQLLIAAELETISELVKPHHERDDAEGMQRAFLGRFTRLADIDPALRRLPLLVGLTAFEPSDRDAAIASSFTSSIAAGSDFETAVA